MPENSLNDILTRLKADDKLVFQQIFQQHYPMVCKTVYRFVRDQDAAQDVAQAVFIKFWEKRQQLQISSSLPAYLRRMAVNEAISALRKQERAEAGRQAIPLYPDISTEDQYVGKELSEHIQLAINQLPPRCREVFVLSRYEELSYKEIAEKLDISIKTVENQMGKALRMMRELLKAYL